MIDILQKNHSVLRQIAKPVDIKTISSKEFKKILKDMKEALDSQDDGVALAAPQIGVSLRLFLASGSMLQKFLKQKKTGTEPKDLVFINPEIVKLSKETKMVEEGCLSIRYLYGKTKRSTKATIRAYDENGELFERGGSGLMAQIFQHEVDHLNGILFTDTAVEVENMPPEHIDMED